MSTQWFVKIGDKHAGPFTSKQVKEMARSGQITPNSHLCKGQNGQPIGQWTSAGNAKGLFEQKANQQNRVSESEDNPNNPKGNSAPEIAVNIQSNDGGSRVKKRRAKDSPLRSVAMISGLFCCFPLGLCLLWTSSFSIKAKLIVTLVCLSSVFLFMSYVNKDAEIQKEARYKEEVERRTAEGRRRDEADREEERKNELRRARIENDPKAFVGEETWKLIQKHLPLNEVRERTHSTSYSKEKILKLDEYFDVAELADDRFTVKGRYDKRKTNRLEMIDGESYIKNYSYEYTAEVDYIGQGKFRLERVTARQFGQWESGRHPVLTYVRKGARPSVTENVATKSRENQEDNDGKDHAGQIGKWADSILGIISIVNEGGAYFITFKDGSRLPLKKTSSRTGQARFIRPVSDNDDYYLINAAGDLESWDSQGHISTATKR